MAVGCVAHPTEHVELVTTEAIADDVPIWTVVKVCQSCDQRLSDYFDGEPITFEGFLVDNVSVMHEKPNREGYAKARALWFIPAGTDDVDAFDCLNIGLFDKEPLNLGGGFVDVEVY